MKSRRWALAAWLAFVVACAAVVWRTEFTTDLSAFLPRSPSPAQQVLVDQLREGVVSRLILIGIEGADPAVLAQKSARLAAALRTDQRFISIDNGEDAGLDKDRELLWRYRYLLSPAIEPGHFSVPELKAALETDLGLLGSPAGVFVQRILPSDPTGELMRLVDDLAGQTRPETRDGVWFSRDAKRALLVAQTRAAGSDIDAQQSAIDAIRAAFAQATAGTDAKSASARLLLTGPGVFSVSSRERIKGDATRISLIATALVATLLLALYRSPRVLVLALLPVATGALAGVAATSLMFGTVHGITLGFGATLIGEGVDYAIYLFTQLAPGVPARNTLRRIWPTLRLGVLTSICGFSAMLFSGFSGLSQLGLFSIVGLIVAVTVTRAILPALLPPGFQAPAAGALAPQIMKVVQRAPRWRYLVLALIAVVVGLALARGGPYWSDDLTSLSPISSAEQKLDEQLRRDVGAPDVRHLVVVTAPDEPAALAASEKIAARLESAVDRGLLESFDSPSRFLPSIALQRTRQAALPQSDILRDNLRQALTGMPFRRDLFEPFLNDVDKARTMEPLARTELSGTRLALKFDSLMLKRDSAWAAMLPLRGVKDFSAIAQDVGAVPDVKAVALDLRNATDQLYRAYRREALRNALIGAAAIVALLFVALRSVKRVADVVAPLAAAVAVTTSLIVLSGTRLSIFHLIGLLLVVAVGSNYSLFFDRRTATLEDRERTVVSLVFANIATVIGFGLLSFSSVPILHAIGATVGAGAVLSLVFAAVFISRAPQPETASTR